MIGIITKRITARAVRQLHIYVDGRLENPATGIKHAARFILERTLCIFLLLTFLLGQATTPSAFGFPLRETSPLRDETWVRLGGPIGGLGYDIRINPQNPDIMYVTDTWSGIHRSLDGGFSWTPINEGIYARSGPSGDAIPIFCATIDPNDPDIIWAGTQEFRGVYRSGDGGDTWEKRVKGIDEDNLTIRGISIEPGNSEVVYIAGEIQSGFGKTFPKTRGFVYKSEDSGANWRLIWTGDNLARYVWIDPNDVNMLYLSTGIFDREAANIDPSTFSSGGVGILKSYNGGETWTPINNGIHNRYIGSLFMHPLDSQVLLAAAGNNAYRDFGGVYRTEDGGESWTSVARGQFHSVEFSTSDPNVAYAASPDAFLRSEDGGKSWLQFSRYDVGGGWGPGGIRPGVPIDLQIDPRDPYRIFVNNYGGGNFLSEDGGLTWMTASDGYTGADLSDISVHPHNPAVVYVNGRSGPFMSVDGGKSWTGLNPVRVQEIAEGSLISIDPSDPEHLIMASAHWGWTYESEDRGATWQLVLDEADNLHPLRVADNNQKFQGIQALEFAPSDPQTVFAGFGIWGCASNAIEDLCEARTIGSLLISKNGGSSWSWIEEAALDGQTVTDIVVHPENEDIAWAATAMDGIYQTVDGGSSWTSQASGRTTPFLMDLAIQPGDPTTLYAASFSGGVFKTVDGGENWSRLGVGMDPNEPLTSIVLDPSRPSVLYAGSRASGVFVSEDAGKTWMTLSDGLRTRAVNSLAISADGRTLYAATRGEGVFRLSTLTQADFDKLQPEAIAFDEPEATVSELPVYGADVDDESRTDVLPTSGHPTDDPSAIEDHPSQESRSRRLQSSLIAFVGSYWGLLVIGLLALLIGCYYVIWMRSVNR
jgi:photosystem II stability/assembly factor-like uncharacterized protein